MGEKPRTKNGSIIITARTSLQHRFSKIELQTVMTTAFLVPLVIIAHELGHFLIAMVLGVPNLEIGLSRIRHGPTPWLSVWQTAAIGVGGPVVSLLLAMSGVLCTRCSKRLVGSLSIAACMRLCEILPFALVALTRWARGAPYRRTTFDEARIFDILGLNGNVGLIVTSIAFGTILVAVLRRHTATSAKSLILGGLIGWATWRIML